MHLSREDGFPTGSIFGNLNYVLLGIHKHLPDAAIVWCWDGLGETWRHRLTADTPRVEMNKEVDEENDYDDAQASIVNSSLSYFGVKEKKKRKIAKVYGYKANRAWTPTKHKTRYPTEEKERAIIQVPVLKLMLDGIGIRQFEIPKLECDDLIGILVHRLIDIDNEVEIYIFSSDKDFYQLLRYKQVTIVKNLKDGKLDCPVIHDVENNFGIAIKDWTKFRAWTGDSTDNIDHLFRVGPATARKFLDDGLDPSCKNINDLSPEALEAARGKYSKYFQPYGIEKLWRSIHNNYLLSKLIKDPDSELLAEDVRKDLRHALKGFDSVKSFRRTKASRTVDMYRKLTVLFSSYELASVLARRSELETIP